MDNELPHQEEEDAPEEPEGPILRLQDLNHYLQSRGLRAADDPEHDHDTAREYREAQAQQRLEQAEAYQEAVHQSIFGNDEEEKNAVDSLKKQREWLEERFGADSRLSITARGGEVVHDVPLLPMGMVCEFVYGMLRSKEHFRNCHVKDNDDGPTDGKREKNVEMTLEEFDAPAVRDFVTVVISFYQDEFQKEFDNRKNKQEQKDQEEDQDAAMMMTEDQKEETDMENTEGFHEATLVEATRLAHYLQSPPTLLNRYATFLQDSLDPHNCLSLCRLADELQLPALLESAVDFVLGRLDELQKNEYWEELPQELQWRVVTLRNAVQSSLLGRGSTKTRVFFHSPEEFLAIFHESLMDQKERLVQAKRRQEEIIRERRLEVEQSQQRRGFVAWRRTRHTNEEDENEECVMGGDVRDAQEKMDRQERRVRTLERFYREQKAIFASFSRFTQDTKSFAL